MEDHMIRVNRSMIAILICAIMVSLFSIKDVSADEHDRMPNLDTGRSSSLTIKFLYHDGRQAETPIPGATFSVYQVAKVATKGGGAYYEATSQFASAGINYNGMTTASSVEAAKKTGRTCNIRQDKGCWRNDKCLRKRSFQ